ncbi:arsenate reductase ArsC [bacterium]|nr:arsenate reductase ArsC [bacterium]
MQVIFACVHNAGRSQMAAALFNQLAPDQSMVAISAGTQPADRVHPEVVEVMSELDIDLSNTQPQLLTEELAGQADFLITMGCGEACPFVPGLKRLDWPLKDPKGQSIDEVRAIRDEIRERVSVLLKESASCSGIK